MYKRQGYTIAYPDPDPRTGFKGYAWVSGGCTDVRYLGASLEKPCLLYTSLRYDTYKKSLIVVTPAKRITLQVDMRNVDYFVIEGQKFVPQGDCFAALLYDSPQMCLTQYIVSTMAVSYTHLPPAPLLPHKPSRKPC